MLAPVDPNDDNFVRGGRKYDVKGRNGRESFTIEVSSGRGTVYAAYSAAPFRFEAYTLGDHWDYKALAPNILPTNPESELNDIVRSMATGSFDYDILTYDVLGRAYADNGSYGLVQLLRRVLRQLLVLRLLVRDLVRIPLLLSALLPVLRILPIPLRVLPVPLRLCGVHAVPVLPLLLAGVLLSVPSILRVQPSVSSQLPVLRLGQQAWIRQWVRHPVPLPR